ncbi:hypothetical protein E2C01_039376 [Portunus trituberculatus]|uniref:Uncharacterized protein n=1 Tax=Portunus trituberculatus TaxID=210409 RepID=A0A5B7FDH5_PORTR|nr:hypothetical protein [Portunus trituberculatus]
MTGAGWARCSKDRETSGKASGRWPAWTPAFLVLLIVHGPLIPPTWLKEEPEWYSKQPAVFKTAPSWYYIPPHWYNSPPTPHHTVTHKAQASQVDQVIKRHE